MLHPHRPVSAAGACCAEALAQTITTGTCAEGCGLSRAIQGMIGHTVRHPSIAFSCCCVKFGRRQQLFVFVCNGAVDTDSLESEDAFCSQHLQSPPPQDAFELKGLMCGYAWCSRRHSVLSPLRQRCSCNQFVRFETAHHDHPPHHEAHKGGAVLPFCTFNCLLC